MGGFYQSGETAVFWVNVVEGQMFFRLLETQLIILLLLFYTNELLVAQSATSDDAKFANPKHATLFTGKKIDDNLMKALTAVNGAGIESVRISFSDGLKATICCLNEKNFKNNFTSNGTHNVLIWPAPMPDWEIRRFIKVLPFEEEKFLEYKLETEIRGANNLTWFHTTISNSKLLCTSICQLMVQLPPIATPDSVAVMRFLDADNKRVSLIAMRYANQQLENDDLLVKLLKSANVSTHDDFGLFVLYESKNPAGESKSECLKFVKEFISSKTKKKQGQE